MNAPLAPCCVCHTETRSRDHRGLARCPLCQHWYVQFCLWRVIGACLDLTQIYRTAIDPACPPVAPDIAPLERRVA